MFGVTTPAVQHIAAALRAITSASSSMHRRRGRSMEKLVDSGSWRGDRHHDYGSLRSADGWCVPGDRGSFRRHHSHRRPYVGAVGALDMVNFGSPDTIPERYRGRKLHVHNPQVTLMRTTAEENERIGRWIGERLNAMDGPVRFFCLKAASPRSTRRATILGSEADAALFRALDRTVRQTSNRQLIRLRCHINEPEFRGGTVAAFRSLIGRTSTRRRVVR